jgi:ssDNA-binding Zn-finger/Zn-ribbon topoisomerase 1
MDRENRINKGWGESKQPQPSSSREALILEKFHRLTKHAKRSERLRLLIKCAEIKVTPEKYRPLREKRKEFEETDYPPRGYCFICRKNEANHRHHIIELLHGGSNNPKNVIGLCSECHTNVHPYIRGRHICPFHKVQMVKRTGPNGDFWGCPEYPQCRKTLNISESNGK